jgi:hypothetical protein
MRGMSLAVLALVCLSSIPPALHTQQAVVKGPKLNETLGPFFVEGQ